MHIIFAENMNDSKNMIIRLCTILAYQAKNGVLLSIMLQDPLFENDDEQIINESLSFFLAGSLT
jgi:hypothetical protein